MDIIRCSTCNVVVYANITDEPYDDDEVQDKMDAHDLREHPA